MSRLYDALHRLGMEHRPPGAPESARPIQLLSAALAKTFKIEENVAPRISISPTPRLVALTNNEGLGAEKFRALATRLENLRHQRELKTLQVVSSVVGEGKTLVAGNLAATLAVQSGSKVLLMEGDLQRPKLASLLGVSQPQLRGLSHWWSGQDRDITHYIWRIKDLPLWFLDAGGICDQPSQILRSERFKEAFTRLAEGFDWIVVDSAPMLPTATANLWSRLLDGTLLVVREGATSVNDLKKGLDALDNPKLLGIVLNDTSELGRASPYYANTTKKTKKIDKKAR